MVPIQHAPLLIDAQIGIICRLDHQIEFAGSLLDTLLEALMQRRERLLIGGTNLLLVDEPFAQVDFANHDIGQILHRSLFLVT